MGSGVFQERGLGNAFYLRNVRVSENCCVCEFLIVVSCDDKRTDEDEVYDVGLCGRGRGSCWTRRRTFFIRIDSIVALL